VLSPVFKREYLAHECASRTVKNLALPVIVWPYKRWRFFYDGLALKMKALIRVETWNITQRHDVTFQKNDDVYSPEKHVTGNKQIVTFATTLEARRNCHWEAPLYGMASADTHKAFFTLQIVRG
jgi:hypothetical protein